jgi:hypothetical protein
MRLIATLGFEFDQSHLGPATTAARYGRLDFLSVEFQQRGHDTMFAAAVDAARNQESNFHS